jgi:UDP-glucuronate decarboxylase
LPHEIVDLATDSENDLSRAQNDTLRITADDVPVRWFINGDRTQTRSFCYVEDLIEAVFLMMNSRSDFTGPVNIGNPYEYTMIELAEKILSLTGSSSKIVFQPLPQDDPKQRKPDIALAQTELGWMPKVALEEGLRETISYFREL